MNRKYYFICITGTIGSGKTTVSNILREYGYFVFDVDLFSKRILTKDKSIMKIIEDLIDEKVSFNGKMDFKKVGQIFDMYPDLEKKFEEWYQVFLGNKIMAIKSSLRSEKNIIFFDIPLLIQKGIVNKFDYLWIVECDEIKQYERIKNRNNYSNEKIKYLIQNSKIDKEKLLCNYKTIDNNYSITKLKRLVKLELKKINIYNKLKEYK